LKGQGVTNQDMQVVADLPKLIAAVKQLQTTAKALPSERDLANRLNVKRHQLRRALSELRKNGDIGPARNRRGEPPLHPRYSDELVRVTNPLEVIELRLMLEPGFARFASLRASTLEIGAIAQWSSTPANAKPETVDINFHLAVATASRNQLAKELFVMLRKIGVDARLRVVGIAPATCTKRIAERDAEHRRIADAIAMRDPDAAEAAMRAHLLLVQRRIIERSSVRHASD
jgi:DNA-binding FadR family transcriptional regulator